MRLARKIIRLALLVFTIIFILFLGVMLLAMFDVMDLSLGFIDALVLPVGIILMVLILVNAFFPKSRKAKQEKASKA